jgi:hypothetical protein
MGEPRPGCPCIYHKIYFVLGVCYYALERMPSTLMVTIQLYNNVAYRRQDRGPAKTKISAETYRGPSPNKYRVVTIVSRLQL